MNLDMRFLKNEKELANSELVLPMKFSLNPWEFSINEKKNFNASLLIYENFDLISFIPMPIGHEASGSLNVHKEVFHNDPRCSVTVRLE